MQLLLLDNRCAVASTGLTHSSRVACQARVSDLLSNACNVRSTILQDSRCVAIIVDDLT